METTSPKYNKGYVMTPREILDCEIWRKPSWYFKVFFYILCRVNHTPSGQLQRGEGFFNFQQERLYDIPPESIHNFLRWGRSKKVNLFTTRKTTRGVIIKINDYDSFHNPESYKQVS